MPRPQCGSSVLLRLSRRAAATDQRSTLITRLEPRPARENSRNSDLRGLECANLDEYTFVQYSVEVCECRNP